MLAKLDYNDVFWGINMSPRVVFSHDVEGITPDPLFMFFEERKSVSAGITFDTKNAGQPTLTTMHSLMASAQPTKLKTEILCHSTLSIQSRGIK